MAAIDARRVFMGIQCRCSATDANEANYVRGRVSEATRVVPDGGVTRCHGYNHRSSFMRLRFAFALSILAQVAVAQTTPIRIGVFAGVNQAKVGGSGVSDIS